MPSLSLRPETTLKPPTKTFRITNLKAVVYASIGTLASTTSHLPLAEIHLNVTVITIVAAIMIATDMAVAVVEVEVVEVVVMAVVTVAVAVADTVVTIVVMVVADMAEDMEAVDTVVVDMVADMVEEGMAEAEVGIVVAHHVLLHAAVATLRCTTTAVLLLLLPEILAVLLLVVPRAQLAKITTTPAPENAREAHPLKREEAVLKEVQPQRGSSRKQGTNKGTQHHDLCPSSVRRLATDLCL